MLKSHNIPTIVLDKVGYNFYGAAKVLEFDIDLFLYLAAKARYLLAQEIDLLMIGTCVGDASVITLPQIEEFKLRKNVKFFNKKNDIYISKDLSPVEACNYVINGR
jgi:hypothetical protein